jgi:hypothetical protein
MNGFHRPARTLLIALAAVAAFTVPASAKAVINPQAGMTWTNYSFDDNEAINEDKARVGYALGGTVRFGGALYLAPGVYYQQTGFEATATNDVTLDTITESVGVSAFHIPVYVGLIVGGTSASSPGLRVYAGPTATLVTSVADNDFGLVTDDYESTIWGGTIGAGFDLTAITFDLNYEIGLTDVFSDPDAVGAKQNVLRGLVGIKF